MSGTSPEREDDFVAFFVECHFGHELTNEEDAATVSDVDILFLGGIKERIDVEAVAFISNRELNDIAVSCERDKHPLVLVPGIAVHDRVD